jgi:hypothetical protein
MPTNPFFRNYDNFNEQNLIDDLVIESIKMYGIDIIYITRSYQAIDTVLNEDDLSIFDQTFEFEVYVKSMDGFEGEGDFLSKFGLQINDTATFTVARRSFERYVTKENYLKSKPSEGDIIYFPLNNQMFEIKFVEDESVFYQMGDLQVYDMQTELLTYSNERFQTGRDNIDRYFRNIDTTMEGTANTSTLETLAVQSQGARNLVFEQDADNILDFTETDPFSEDIDIPDLDS